MNPYLSYTPKELPAKVEFATKRLARIFRKNSKDTVVYDLGCGECINTIALKTYFKKSYRIGSKCGYVKQG